MAEYIKREDAMSHPFANGKYDHKNANTDFILGSESYKEWLEALPAADVRENVRGKWRIDEDGFYYNCSECGKLGIKGNWNYCPNCGADMRGENND